MTDLFPALALAPDAPRGLGKAMAGGGDKVKRRSHDYYPTPEDASTAFFLAEQAHIKAAMVRGCFPAFWEPCGRGGAIARVASRFDLPSVASDVVPDPANGVEPLDLLRATVALAPVVVTNPPFAIWREMLVRLWLHLRVDYVAFLLKAQAMNCDEAAKLAEAGMTPNGEWKVCWRLDFLNLGNPTMDCNWYVWDRHNTARRGGWLRRTGPVVERVGGLI